jgi:hypothetical protein
MRNLALASVALAFAVRAPTADAFCGFYVSGSGEKLYNDATQVVLMRDGTKTVLSMLNDYRGPLADFAMVVPVPVVLHQSDVKTIPKVAFDHIDALGSPRLVEYWEQDPCPSGIDPTSTTQGITLDKNYIKNIPVPGRTFGVKIEAQYDVAEYHIMILSATEATGLESWLHHNGYKIPDGASQLLRPYIESGSKFFVAKVDPHKVSMVDGHAALSPLRFHYDTDEFSLPIRLGLASSSGKQDLIVNIVSPSTRYQVGNYKNAFIPTNIDVSADVKSRFAEFYAALFDKTLEANPGAVITEYAWTAVPNYHCDPCTGADVDLPELMDLGGDVVGGQVAQGNFVLTRLHARYSPTDMRDDLRFLAALPMTGGREVYSISGLETGPQRSEKNYFQARYAIRHRWTGAVACKSPRFGVWGGPPGGVAAPVTPATNLAFAPRGKLAVADVVQRDVWEIGLRKKPGKSPHAATQLGVGIAAGLLLIGFLLWRRARRIG